MVKKRLIGATIAVAITVMSASPTIAEDEGLLSQALKFLNAGKTTTGQTPAATGSIVEANATDAKIAQTIEILKDMSLYHDPSHFRGAEADSIERINMCLNAVI